MRQDPLQTSPPSRPPDHGRLVAAGVLAACVLGAGLGLWARPVSPEQERAEAAPPQPVSPGPALQIVVDDTPAPIGALLEVLPGDPEPAAATEPPPPPPPSPPPLPVEPIAPHRSATGLVKVDAPVVVAEPILAPAMKAAPKPMPKFDLKPPPKEKVAQAKPSKPERRDVARIQKAEKAEPARLAKARQVEPARAQQPAKAKAVKLIKTEKASKAKAVKLARAEPKKAAARAQPRPQRLATLVRASKPAPKKPQAEVRQVAQRKPVQVAAAKPRTPRAATPQRPVLQKAVLRKPPTLKPARRPARIEKVATSKVALPPPKRVAIKPPAVRRPVPRGEGPMRVARANPCNANPFACGAQQLSVRERQLEQAYRSAEAAGVPAEALRRQQARWLNARAAAAREAPWAVEDVYEARISELNDLSRDAREN
jgi:hypothetical protein